MTKAETDMVALAIAKAREDKGATSNATITLVVRHIALALEADNPRFDSDRFINLSYS